MITGSVNAGRGVTGLMVCGPVPGMLKLMMSGTFTVAFADRIACRKDPLPLSAALVTTKVAAFAGPTTETWSSPVTSVTVDTNLAIMFWELDPKLIRLV